MFLTMIGISHKTANMEVLDRCYFTQERIDGFLKQTSEFISEVVILQTCNRLEIFLVSELACEDFLVKTLISLTGLLEEEIRSYFYFLEQKNAILHLLEVSSSLDSVVVGEAQILSQIKSAYQKFREMGKTSKFLNRLFEMAVRVGKRVRTETSISRGAVSVSQASVELGRKFLGSYQGRKAVVLGAGEIGRLALKHLSDCEIEKLWLMNRTPAKAIDVARSISCEPCGLDRLEEILCQVDIIICAISYDGFILDVSLLKKIMRERRFRTIFLIDISLPRTIDPKISEIDGAFVYDIEDLKSVVEANLRERLSQKDEIDRIIAQEIQDFEDWSSRQAMVPYLKKIQEYADQVVQEEVLKWVQKLPDTSDASEKIMQRLANSVAKKVSHLSIQILNQVQMDCDQMDSLRKIFPEGHKSEQKDNLRDILCNK